jgi:trehalose synthase
MGPVDTVTPSRAADIASAAHPPPVATQIPAKILHVTARPPDDGAAEARSALARAHGLGIDARWIRLTSSGSFAALCERLIARLRGATIEGGGVLEREEQLIYTAVSQAAVGMVNELAASCDLAFLHGPATAGLCGPLKEAGAGVVWVCHAEIGEPDEGFRKAWGFLSPHIEPADAVVLVRASWIPAHRARQRVVVVASPATHRSAAELAEAEDSGLVEVLASITEARR